MSIKSFAKIYSSYFGSSSVPTFALTFAYSYDLFTQSAKFDGNVHGVVVHANIYVFSSSATLNFAIHVKSFTSLYPCATSCDESAVPHLGQYGITLCPSYKRPFSHICFNAHHTDSIYSL